MRYVVSRYEIQNREDAYRIYISDALKAMGKLNIRYYDMIHPQEIQSEEDAERIAEETKDRIKGILRNVGRKK